MLLNAVRWNFLDIVEAILVHCLIAGDVHTFDKKGIGGDPHTGLDHDQISNDNLRHRAGFRCAVVPSNYLHLLVSYFF